MSQQKSLQIRKTRVRKQNTNYCIPKPRVGDTKCSVVCYDAGSFCNISMISFNHDLSTTSTKHCWVEHTIPSLLGALLFAPLGSAKDNKTFVYEMKDLVTRNDPREG